MLVSAPFFSPSFVWNRTSNSMTVVYLKLVEGSGDGVVEDGFISMAVARLAQNFLAVLDLKSLLCRFCCQNFLSQSAEP